MGKAIGKNNNVSKRDQTKETNKGACVSKYSNIVCVLKHFGVVANINKKIAFNIIICLLVGTLKKSLYKSVETIFGFL